MFINGIKKKWQVIFIVSLVLNVITFYLFGHIHVELWDYSMNSILISREEFAMMNRRGVLFFIVSIATSMIFIKVIMEYRHNNNN